MRPTPPPHLAPLDQLDGELAHLRTLDEAAFDASSPREIEIWTPIKVVPPV